MRLSSLLDRFAEPETLKMAKLGRELRAKGIDVIDLSLGEPDFDTPEHIKAAAKKAIDDNWSHYTPVAGYADLREAVCVKFKRDNNLDYKPENIVVSTGAKQPRPRCATRRLEPAMLRHLQGSRPELASQVVEEVTDHPIMALFHQVNPMQ